MGLWGLSGAILGPKLSEKGQFWHFLNQYAMFSHSLSKYHQNMFIWFCILLIIHLWSFFWAYWLYLGPKLTQKGQFQPSLNRNAIFSHNLSKYHQNTFIGFCILVIMHLWLFFGASWFYFRSKIVPKRVNFDPLWIEM